MSEKENGGIAMSEERMTGGIAAYSEGYASFDPLLYPVEPPMKVFIAVNELDSVWRKEVMELLDEWWRGYNDAEKLWKMTGSK